MLVARTAAQFATGLLITELFPWCAAVLEVGQAAIVLSRHDGGRPAQALPTDRRIIKRL